MMIALFSVLAVLMASFLVDILTAVLDPAGQTGVRGNDMNAELTNTRSVPGWTGSLTGSGTRGSGQAGQEQDQPCRAQMLENRLAVIGLVVFAIILISCLLAPLFSL